MNSEEQEAYLQWEAENLISQQQWSDADQGSDVPWSTADQAGDGQWTEAWSTGMSDYEQWSGDQDQVYGYDESVSRSFFTQLNILILTLFLFLH